MELKSKTTYRNLSLPPPNSWQDGDRGPGTSPLPGTRGSLKVTMLLASYGKMMVGVCVRHVHSELLIQMIVETQEIA